MEDDEEVVANVLNVQAKVLLEVEEKVSLQDEEVTLEVE